MRGFKRQMPVLYFPSYTVLDLLGGVRVELLGFVPSYDIRLSIRRSFPFFWPEVSALPQ